MKLITLLYFLGLMSCQPQPSNSHQDVSNYDSPLNEKSQDAEVVSDETSDSSEITFRDHVQPTGPFATFLAGDENIEKFDPQTLIPTKVTIIEEGDGITSSIITWVEAYTHNHSGHFEYEICSQVLSEAEKVGLKDNGCARGRVRWDHILLDTYYSDYYYGDESSASKAGLQVDAIEGRATLRLRQCIPGEFSSTEETCGPWVVKDFYHRHNTAGNLNLYVKERQKELAQLVRHVKRVGDFIDAYEVSREKENTSEHCKKTELPREVIKLLERIDIIKKALDTLKPIGFSEGLASAKRTIEDLEKERSDLEEKYKTDTGTGTDTDTRKEVQTRLQLVRPGVLTSGGGSGFNPDTLDEIGDSLMPIIQDTILFGKLTKPKLKSDCNRDALFAQEITRELQSITYIQQSIAQYTEAITEELESRKKASDSN